MDKKNQGGTDTEAEIAAEGAGEKELSLRYENRRQVVKGGILGFFIGLAVIVPGVSGSAVAIIFKLYEKLPYALGSFFRKFKTCRKVRFRLHSSDERQNLYGKQYSGNMIGAEGSLPGQFP